MGGRHIAVLTAICCALLAPLVVMVCDEQARMHATATAEAMAMVDMQHAQIAADDGEAEEARIAEEQAYAEAYVYYAPSYGGGVWYESDDADAEYEAKEWIAWRESGGDYDARNGQYIGKFQLSEDKLDGDWSPENQEATADAYVADRYGSWQAAKEHWESAGWY